MLEILSCQCSAVSKHLTSSFFFPQLQTALLFFFIQVIRLLQEQLQTEVLELHCNLHPLDTFAKESREALKAASCPELKTACFGTEGPAPNLLYAISKLRFKRDFLISLEKLLAKYCIVINN